MEDDRAPRGAVGQRRGQMSEQEEGVVHIHEVRPLGRLHCWGHGLIQGTHVQGTDLSRLAVMPGTIQVAVFDADDEESPADDPSGSLEILRKEAARRKARQKT